MGAITGYIDVAQIALYVFWLFFFALVFYLQRESKREGFPLEYDDALPGAREKVAEGFPSMPSPKTYRLHDGSSVQVPTDNGDKRPLALERTYAWPGSPYDPTGNPMTDGVGPASWAERADVPDMTHEHQPKLSPMRVATGFSIADGDADPRGMSVLAADGKVAGTVADVWVDVEEVLIRYLEVAVPGWERHVLLPMTFSRVDGMRRVIKVSAITSEQFAGVPVTANPDQVTRLEEDKIMGYFGGGKLYATAARAKPWL